MEEDLSIYQRLKQIENKEIKIPQIQSQPQNSQVIKRWKMSKVDRLKKCEEYELDEETRIQNQLEELPSYYYNNLKVNPNSITYQRNPKQNKQEKGVKEGKHPRSVKQGTFTMK